MAGALHWVGAVPRYVVNACGNSNNADKISVISAHVPDITTFSGLCDMMLLGNICELGVLLQRRFYEGGGKIEDTDLEECRMAGWRYRQFQTWFQSTHVLVVKGRCYEPLAAFRWSLIQFTAAVCWHKYRYNEAVPHHPNFLSQTLLSVLDEFFRLEYPELLPRWQQVYAEKTQELHWNGPKFDIRLRTDVDREVLMEFEDFPLSMKNEVENEADESESQDHGEGADRSQQNQGKKRKRSKTLGE